MKHLKNANGQHERKNSERKKKTWCVTCICVNVHVIDLLLYMNTYRLCIEKIQSHSSLGMIKLDLARG